jgi:uncharacterized membrane protein
VSKKNRNRNNNQIVQQQQPNSGFATVTQSVSFSGPLPHPSLLEKYNEVIPNGAERIMAMAERQSAHREALETKVVDSNIKNQARGTLFAFILSLVSILGGFWLIAHGQSPYGIATIITALATLAGVFVYNKHQQRKERGEKQNTIASRRADGSASRRT